MCTVYIAMYCIRNNYKLLVLFLYMYLPESPTQILCEQYSFFVENLQSSVVCKMMEQEKLLNGTDLLIIFNAPMEYISNCYIFEHVRHMETADLFKFLNILQKFDSQKHINEIMISGT